MALAVHADVLGGSKSTSGGSSGGGNHQSTITVGNHTPSMPSNWNPAATASAAAAKSTGSSPNPSGSNPGSNSGAGSYGGGGYSGGGYSGGGSTPSGTKPTTEELLNQEIYNPTTGGTGGTGAGSDPGTGGTGTGGDPGTGGTGAGTEGGGAGAGDGSNNGGDGSGGGNPYQHLGNGAPSAYTLPELDGPNPERVNHVDTETLRNMLQQIVDASTEQANLRIDHSVEQGTNELNRAMEDAAKQFQTQRDQTAAEEAQALDNQALYAEARGDRGGIGAAQYASIQNTAAQNRRAVNDAQVKLGTDTARQIADLRSQGEFQKADQLLSITQSHLAQLKDLEQWALGTNLGVDEFNSQLQQWVDEFNLQKQQYLSDLDLSAAQLTGMFSDGTRTYAAQQALIESLANSGNALLQAGVMPSRQQLEAMGLTEVQAKAYFNKMGFAY